MRLTLLRKEVVVLLLAVVSLCVRCVVQDVYGQAAKAERVHALGINPIKLVMGLANVEYERRGTRHVGFRGFAEYRVVHWMEHPDLVARGGVHYYVAPEERDLRGPCAGLNAGVSWSSNQAGRDEGFFIGSGLGGRLVFGDRFYVSPRLVLHYLVSQKKILWGVEAPVGVLF